MNYFYLTLDDVAPVATITLDEESQLGEVFNVYVATNEEASIGGTFSVKDSQGNENSLSLVFDTAEQRYEGTIDTTDYSSGSFAFKAIVQDGVGNESSLVQKDFIINGLPRPVAKMDIKIEGTPLYVIKLTQQ